MSRRTPREPSFSAIVAGVRRSTGAVPEDGRNVDRLADHGVWDADGRFWPASEVLLSSAEVERVLADPEVVVGLHHGYQGGVEWCSSAEAAARWAAWIRARFADEGDLAAGGWPDQIAYTAEVRVRPDGARLLWLDGHC